MTALWRLDATEVARRVTIGEVSAREVTLSALARLDAVNPRLNAVVQTMPEEALAAADAVDAAIARGEAPGMLAGVPVTIKVNTDQKGFATTNGLKLQADHRATEDSPVVSSFRRAGAVIIGRTNTPAFSLRWFTSNDIHGETYNPRDKGLTPGGSSGGAGSATAAGIGAIGHGTDIGGSVRYPAYACGIHGLRPTLGRIAAWNPSLPDRDIGPQLMAVSGPLARSIPDLRLALAAMSARDPRDPWWVPAPLEGPPAPKRAALCVAPEGMKVAPPVVAALRDAAARLHAAGWEVEEVAEVPPLREPARMQARLWLAMLPRGGMAMAEREGEKASLAVFGHMTSLSQQPGLAEFQDTLTIRMGFLRAWSLFFERYPVVIVPVSGELPFANHADQGGAEAFQAIIEAQLVQVGLPLMGLPGLTVSTGMVGKAPVGVQLLAGRYREDLLLAAGEDIAAGGTPPSPIDPDWDWTGAMRSLLLLPLLLTACVAPPSGGTGGCSGQLDVRNAASSAVEQLYVSTSGPADWGRDHLAPGTLPPGAARSITVRPGLNSVRVVFVNGRATEMAGMDVCATPVLTVQSNGLQVGR